jgi:hypothetical protein
MMRLRSDKLINSKLDNIELKEITGATRSNINSRNQILVLGQTLSKSKLKQE